MRLLGICAVLLLLLGCLGAAERAENATANETVNESRPTTIQTATIEEWEVLEDQRFSFHYPANMEIEHVQSGPNGLITGEHQLPEKTGEILAVAYTDIFATYGENQDLTYQKNPEAAAIQFLEDDLDTDSMGFLMKAHETGNISTFALVKSSVGAEAPFKLRLNAGTTYYGHAISIYVPDRSLHFNVRIIAVSPEVAQSIRDEFLLTLRVK